MAAYRWVYVISHLCADCEESKAHIECGINYIKKWHFGEVE